MSNSLFHIRRAVMDSGIDYSSADHWKTPQPRSRELTKTE